MKKQKILCTFICLFLFSLANCQTISRRDKLFEKVEDFVLNNQEDSGRMVLKKIQPATGEYHSILSKIVNKRRTDYSEYLTFFRHLDRRQEVDHLKSYKLFNELVKEPKDGEFIYDYAQICWYQASRLRNETELDKAGEVQERLLSYIGKHDEKKRDVKRAQILANTHEIVLNVIEKDVKNGLKLCQQNEQEARALKDTNLVALCLYNTCDFLILEGKLDQYIEMSQSCYILDSVRVEKSGVYFENLVHLIDALIYKGGEDHRVLRLLNELYNSKGRELSFSLVAKYLRFSEPNSPTAKRLFDQFGAHDIASFCDTISAIGEPLINPNEFYYLTFESAKALENYGEFEKALKYMSKAMGLNREIYAHDLSQSLANYQSELVRQEKELEIEREREQSRLNTIIAILAIVLFIFALFGFILKRRQSRLLLKKTEQIEEQRKELEKSNAEKSLLLKEIHHRVKNNFQIVSSLLEMQTRGIEDEQALELAKEGQNRIKSMAIIHQKLYQNDDLLIEFEEYVERLVSEIQNTFASKKMQTKIQVAPGLILDIDTAIPLGLMLNELITNAFKYGFDEEKDENNLLIRIEKGLENYSMFVEDNGSGISEDVDLKKTKSLGLYLVRRLSKQLGGSMDYSNENGSRFEITFKDTAMRMA